MIQWLGFAEVEETAAISPAGGGTPVDLQTGLKWGWTYTLVIFKNSIVYEKESWRRSTPNSSQVGGGFACPRQRGIWAAFFA